MSVEAPATEDPEAASWVREQLNAGAALADTSQAPAVTRRAKERGRRRRHSALAAALVVVVAPAAGIAVAVHHHRNPSPTLAAGKGPTPGSLGQRQDLIRDAFAAWTHTSGAHSATRALYAGLLPGSDVRLFVLSGLDRRGRDAYALVTDEVPGERPLGDGTQLAVSMRSGAQVFITEGSMRTADQLQPELPLVVIGDVTPDVPEQQVHVGGITLLAHRLTAGVYGTLAPGSDMLGQKTVRVGNDAKPIDVSESAITITVSRSANP